jgi:hypothetical protein
MPGWRMINLVQTFDATKKRVQGQERVVRTFGSLRRHHRGDLRRDALY